MGPGESPAHLENCTGKKKLISAKVETVKRKIPVRSGAEETGKHKSKYVSHLKSLRNAIDTELARSSE